MKKSSIFCALSIALTICSPSFSMSLVEQVQQRNKLRVCIWPDYYAISYQSPRTGKLNGIDIDMAKAFAKHLSVELEFIDSSFAKLQRNITKGHCDIAMHGVAIRNNRKAYMDFSKPYLRSDIYGISMKSNPQIRTWQDIDQQGVIAVVQKETYMEPVMRQALKKAQLLVVNNFKAREQAVQSGRADVFMTDFPYAQRMVSLTKWARLLKPDQPFSSTDYAYAVAKGDSKWLAEVNLFLSNAKSDGSLQALAAKYKLSPIVLLQP